MSTTITPLAVTNTAVLPPPPFSMNRLSLSFSTSTTFGLPCGCPLLRRFAAIDRAPNASRTPRDCHSLHAIPPGKKTR